jgi:hypothetical protein
MECFHAALFLPLQTREICNRAVNVENLQGSEDMRGDLRTLCRIATLTQPGKQVRH